jgi:hypothetical protein
MAAAQALFANANRDPKRGKPFAPKDFCLFAQRDEEQRPQVPPEVAAVALALRHEGKAPPIVIAAWPQLIAGASATVKVPSVRALRSDDDRVWVLCPSRTSVAGWWPPAAMQQGASSCGILTVRWRRMRCRFLGARWPVGWRVDCC